MTIRVDTYQGYDNLLIGDLKEQSNGAGGVEGGGDVSLTTYIVHGLTGGNEAYTRSGTMYRLNLS